MCKIFLNVFIALFVSQVFSQPLKVLCIDNNKKCFIIENQKESNQILSMTDSIRYLTMDIECSTWNLRYFNGCQLLKEKIFDNGKANNIDFNKISNFIKNHSEVQIYKIYCDLNFYNRVISGKEENFDYYLNLNEKDNYPKVIIKVNSPDTLNFNIRALKIASINQGVFPEKASLIRLYLENIFPSFLQILCRPIGMHTENDNRVIYNSEEIEALFPIGYPCQFIANNSAALYKLGNIQCIKPDTLTLQFYTNDLQKLNQLKNKQGIFNIIRITDF